MLTGIDSLNNCANVLICCTSNLLSLIDPAFVDRADIVQFIGNPSKEAIKRILQNSLQELILDGLISKERADPVLFEALARRCEEKGVSGRFVTRLPFLTFVSLESRAGVGLNAYIKAMLEVVEDGKSRELLDR